MGPKLLLYRKSALFRHFLAVFSLYRELCDLHKVDCTMCMDEDHNIIGLVLKTGGYPEPVTVYGCHGNQVKFKISISKKFLISPPSKNGPQTNFLRLLVSYGYIYEAYGHFNSWKPFAFDRSPIKDNSLFRHHIQNRSLLRHSRR